MMNRAPLIVVAAGGRGAGVDVRGTPRQRAAGWRHRIAAWRARRAARRQLAACQALDPRFAADIGLTPDELAYVDVSGGPT
jgi:hypothetical protein